MVQINGRQGIQAEMSVDGNKEINGRCGIQTEVPTNRNEKIKGEFIMVESGLKVNENSKFKGEISMEKQAEAKTKCRKYIKHGLSKTRFYKEYHHMIDRCKNPSHPRWDSYGGSGIKVCERWRGDDGFINFRDDWYKEYELLKNKYHPEERRLSLARIDPDGDYCLDNTRWVDWAEENNPRIKGKFIGVCPGYGTAYIIDADKFANDILCSVSLITKCLNQTASDGSGWYYYYPETKDENDFIDLVLEEAWELGYIFVPTGFELKATG
ncbi:hypothetical protein [Desulfobacula sp.]|uniref:hypothetical protein n=1 Tax=Desulfobacula sp. TaxID=2593537 RepID=UPI0026339160|nr:hypothetical protein [Desulfobacula sp.]